MSTLIQYHLDLLNASQYACTRYHSKRASEQKTKQLLWLLNHEVAIYLGTDGRYALCAF